MISEYTPTELDQKYQKCFKENDEIKRVVGKLLRFISRGGDATNPTRDYRPEQLADWALEYLRSQGIDI